LICILQWLSYCEVVPERFQHTPGTVSDHAY
jgi:hypothetical protein